MILILTIMTIMMIIIILYVTIRTNLTRTPKYLTNQFITYRVIKTEASPISYQRDTKANI